MKVRSVVRRMSSVVMSSTLREYFVPSDGI